MQDTTHLRHNHREQEKLREREDTAREDERFLAPIPSRTNVQPYGTDIPSPEVYRQAVKVVMATPELENRMNYVTASLFVTVFGSWLAGRMLKTRAFLFFVDLILFIGCLAIAGLLIGVMVGENILPAETIPVLLFVAIAIVLLLVGFVLGNMLLGAAKPPRRTADGRIYNQNRVVSVESRGTYANHSGATTTVVYTPRVDR